VCQSVAWTLSKYARSRPALQPSSKLLKYCRALKKRPKVLPGSEGIAFASEMFAKTYTLSVIHAPSAKPSPSFGTAKEALPVLNAKFMKWSHGLAMA
jgi:hypothetical protein